VKRDVFLVLTNTVRFTKGVISFAQKVIVGEPDPDYRAGKDGYTDRVIPAIQGLKEYLSHEYRRLIDVGGEMPRVAKPQDFTPKTVPHFSLVYP
jgi:hypothetical protein